MIFRLTFRQIRRNAVESAIFFIQLILTVVIITYVGTSLQNAVFSAQSVHLTSFDEFSYYQEKHSLAGSIIRGENSGASQEEMMQKMQQSGDSEVKESITRIYSTTFQDENFPTSPYTGWMAQIKVVEPALADHTILPLSEGEWFDPQWDESQGYQAIVSTDISEYYHLGETYSIPVEGVFGENSGEITIHVVGVLSHENYSYPNTTPLVNEFLERGYYGFIIRAENPTTIGSSYGFSDSGYIYGNISEETDGYSITPMTEKVQEFMDREYAQASFTAVIGGVVIALALLGISCSIVIRTGADIKRYAVMSFCGARWRDCVMIEAGKVMTVYLSAMAVSAIVVWVVIPMITRPYYYQQPFSPAAFWIGIAAAFLLYIPASLWKVWHTAKQNPIEVIKED